MTTENQGRSIEDNPNIGALGRAEYQKDNDRVKGFCGTIVKSPNDYLSHFEEFVYPEVQKFNPSRVIDRAIVADPTDIGDVLNVVGLTEEARIPLGGRWEGYSWVMLGRVEPGRILSEKTFEDLYDLAHRAASVGFAPPREISPEYSIEFLAPERAVEEDAQELASIFASSFTDYISPLTDPSYIEEWISDPSTMPVVARSSEGKIVVVTSGDLGVVHLDEGMKEFKFFEIGDSASNPKYEGLGLNRRMKYELIRRAKQLGFDSIHAETRSCYENPNFANTKNGMRFSGILPSNCLIRSERETVPESHDPNLASWARKFGSLTVWSMNPKNPNWNQY